MERMYNQVNNYCSIIRNFYTQNKFWYWKSFKTYLSYIDLFGQKIDLTYKNEVLYRTYYGALYTLFLFLIIILETIAGYREITSQKNPIINMMEVESKNVEKINLFDENITIAFTVNTKDRRNHLVNNTLYSFESKLISRSQNETSDKISTFLIKHEKCRKANFQNYENIYTDFSLENAFCLVRPNENDKKVELFTSPQDFSENYLKLKLRVCENNSLVESNCFLNDDFIKNIMPTLKLNIYVIHKYFDGIDIEHPIKSRLSFLTFNLEEEVFLKKKINYSFNKNILTDYSDFLSAFIDPEPISFVGFKPKDKQSYIIYDRDGGVNFVEIYFRLDNIPIKFTRKYITFIDLLATIGGLFNALFILGMVIFGFINRLLLDVKIINDHFNIIKNEDIYPPSGSPFVSNSANNSNNIITKNHINDKISDSLQNKNYTENQIESLKNNGFDMKSLNRAFESSNTQEIEDYNKAFNDDIKKNNQKIKFLEKLKKASGNNKINNIARHLNIDKILGDDKNKKEKKNFLINSETSNEKIINNNGNSNKLSIIRDNTSLKRTNCPNANIKENVDEKCYSDCNYTCEKTNNFLHNTSNLDINNNDIPNKNTTTADIKIENNNSEENNENKENTKSKLSHTYTMRSVSFDSMSKNINVEENPFRKLHDREIEFLKIQEENKTDYYPCNVETNKRSGQNQKKKEKSFKLSNYYKLRYGIKELLKTAFCFKYRSLNKRNQIFYNCKKVIDNYLDINNIIPLIQEFKIAKSLLFSKSQLLMINHYKKPIIKIYDNKSKFIFRKSDIYENFKMINYFDYEENLRKLKEEENEIPQTPISAELNCVVSNDLPTDENKMLNTPFPLKNSYLNASSDEKAFARKFYSNKSVDIKLLQLSTFANKDLSNAKDFYFKKSEKEPK